MYVDKSYLTAPQDHACGSFYIKIGIFSWLNCTVFASHFIVIRRNFEKQERFFQTGKEPSYFAVILQTTERRREVRGSEPVRTAQRDPGPPV